jgi:hypothetical protein
LRHVQEDAAINELVAPDFRHDGENVLVTMKEVSNDQPAQNGEEPLKYEVTEPVAELAQAHESECLPHLVLFVLNHTLKNEPRSNLCHVRDIESHEERHQQNLSKFEGLGLLRGASSSDVVTFKEFGQIV